MDVSLTTLKDAFADTAYQCRMRDFKVFMFILATPADSIAFKELLEGFDELHYLTADDVLVTGPSLKVNDKKATRQELAFISDRDNDDYGKQVFEKFRTRQLEESYDFCHYIGLPSSELPCLVFFDTLHSPTQFVSVRLRVDPSQTLVGQVRQTMDSLRSKCKWRERDELRRIREDLNRQYPYAILYNQDGVYQSLERDQARLRTARNRLTKSLANSTPAQFLDTFQTTLAALRDRLDASVLASLSPDKRARTEQALLQLADGHYRPNALDHLRMFRKTHKRTLSDPLHSAFADFFHAADDLFRCDRLRATIADLDATIARKKTQLDEEIDREKERLRHQLEALESDVSVSAGHPLGVLADLPNAKSWKLRSPATSSGWLLDQHKMAATRLHVDEERPPATAFPEFALTDATRYDLRNEAIDAVILVAVKVELEAALAALEPLDGRSEILRIADSTDKKIYYCGRLGSGNVVVTMCRMGSSGRGSSLITTYKSIVSWKPRFVIMVGIAFGRDNQKQRFGDVLVSSVVHCYELQRRNADLVIRRGPSPECGEYLRELFENEHDWSFPIGTNLKARMLVGPILSGEKLIDDPAFKRSLFEAYPDAIGGEMEAAGVYAGAATGEVEWIVVKGICDWADGTKSDGFQPLAARSAVSLVRTVLSHPHSLESPSGDGPNVRAPET